MNQLKRGQRIFVKGAALDFSPTLEPATIVGAVKMTAADIATRPDLADFDCTGWYRIKYEDGGKMCCHVDRMSLGNY